LIVNEDQLALERVIREVKHSPRADKALTALNAALETLRLNGDGTPCKGLPEKYIDYEPEDAPTRFQARVLCISCPIKIKELCGRYADESQRDYERRGYELTGVYGGAVYGAAKNLTQIRPSTRMDET
jgi:hypothetical protein